MMVHLPQNITLRLIVAILAHSSAKKGRRKGVSKFKRQKISAIARRTAQTKRASKVDTYKIRVNFMKSLREAFEMAESFAKDKNLKPEQRQIMSRRTVHMGQS